MFLAGLNFSTSESVLIIPQCLIEVIGRVTPKTGSSAQILFVERVSMMFRLTSLLATVAAVAAARSEHDMQTQLLTAQFESWALKHGKAYSDAGESSARMAVWMDNHSKCSGKGALRRT